MVYANIDAKSKMKFKLFLVWNIVSFMRLVFLVFPFHGKERRRRTAKKAGFRDDNMSFNKARCVFYQGLVGFNRCSACLFIQAGCVFSKTIAVHSQESGREEVRGNEEQSSIGGDEP